MSVAHSLKTYFINLANKKFPIYFGPKASQGMSLQSMPNASRGLIVTNTTVQEACAQCIQTIGHQLGISTKVLALEDGESFKTLATVSHIIDTCIEHQMTRHDIIIAVGGGVVGDMAGFAAASYLRGIPFIQVPTSLLGQVDAAIGGKTGVNHAHGKNLIGAFYQPIQTIIDPALLESLKPEQMKEGLAEIVKYAVIMDKPLFWYIEQHLSAIQSCRYSSCPDIWHYLIEKSIQNKALVVSQDEKEAQLREILNHGHTIGHAMESALGYADISHGQAVAVGMVVEAHLAMTHRYLSNDTYQKIHGLIQSLGFELAVPSIPESKFLSALTRDKKVKKGEVRFVVPTDIGQTKVISGITEAAIIDSIQACLGEVFA